MKTNILMRKYSYIWMLLCCLAYGGMTSCSGKKSDADEQDKGVSTVLPDSKNEVTVQILKRCDFHHELVSNGKVSARGQADLRFETNEVIAHVYVKTVIVFVRGRSWPSWINSVWNRNYHKRKMLC